MLRLPLLLVLALLAAVLAGCGSSATSTTAATKSAAAGALVASPAVATSSPTAPSAATSSAVASPGAAVTRAARPATGPLVSSAASPATGAKVPVLHGSLTVFAAASLTESFNQLGEALKAASPDLKLSFNYAGSSALRTQLAQGAKADVFAPADQQNMQGATQDGTIAGPPQTFARNRLVVVVPAGNPGHIDTLQDLAKPGLKLVLAQEQVPVGNYARQAFDKLSQAPSFGADFKPKVLANLVSDEPDVKSALSKVELGEADASVVYVTDITPDAQPKVKTIAIPDQFNVIASYPVATVKGAPDADNARAFIDYVLSPAGQAILASHGFAAP